jgi:hypothetical protein
MKTEAACSSETLVYNHTITRNNNQEYQKHDLNRSSNLENSAHFLIVWSSSKLYYVYLNTHYEYKSAEAVRENNPCLLNSEVVKLKCVTQNVTTKNNKV